jgi:hypothetical protein
MKGKGWMALCMGCFGLTLFGCAPIWLGAGAVGGYAVSRDSVVDHLDYPPDAIYREALTVVKQMGEITLEAPKQRMIQAKIDRVSVKVTVRPLTERTVELRIRARNQWLMPRVDVAQRVYGKIKERL